MEPVILGLCLVDFHHTRGPEVEYWYGLPEGTDSSKIWPNLPFQALPDGSHSFKETFTYFTLLFNEKKKCSPPNGATDLPEGELNHYTTLFAISCSRQIRSDELTHKDKDITRSTVQKAIVVISRQPIFGQIKDKLSLVTNAFFLQRNFSDRSIISSLHGNLISIFDPLPSNLQDSLFYVGLSLRRIIYEFKKDTLILLKAILLEKKLVFYGTNVEALCNLQFGLISLIPNLLSDLEKSGSPQMYDSCEGLKAADSFKSSDRQSVLRFLGFPLKIFEKGGLFAPYTPLQQMDDISSTNTDFFVIGSSNSLLTEQKSEFCHVFVNVDDSSIEILDKTLQPALQLSGHDKKWIEYVSNMVSETWNENDLFTPKNSQFEGSEDFLRWQFEDYLTGLLSSVKLSDYIEVHKNNSMVIQSIPDNVLNSHPINLFNANWVSRWKETQNYEIFKGSTDDRLFDIFPPKHAYNGIGAFGVIQQKLAATFQNLRKSNSGSSIGSSKVKTADSSESIEQDDVSTKSTVAAAPETSQSSSEKDHNIWSSWRDYFNVKKQGKKGEPDLEIKATQHLNDSSSTSVAIGSALLGLGLHLNDKDERMHEDESNLEKEAPHQGESNNEAKSEHKEESDLESEAPHEGKSKNEAKSEIEDESNQKGGKTSSQDQHRILNESSNSETKNDTTDTQRDNSNIEKEIKNDIANGGRSYEQNETKEDYKIKQANTGNSSHEITIKENDNKSETKEEEGNKFETKEDDDNKSETEEDDDKKSKSKEDEEAELPGHQQDDNFQAA
ncbi:hypothetical protein HG535_0G04010 [Zygotorulaspora mrakii]|uniref:UDENN domain-containing protein n=1 Tax=Zygotorulaspora mrakii TaxID=42260 RepID=A0A7H9B712_ZYGMR|nr:uncharacterized protein HG535_0G04010 [Zygotorulaspora mrakii]QLG74518.1 hypothetical protein HG535_0G04010 [Zygotorulaspora mrakii]